MKVRDIQPHQVVRCTGNGYEGVLMVGLDRMSGHGTYFCHPNFNWRERFNTRVERDLEILAVVLHDPRLSPLNIGWGVYRGWSGIDTDCEPVNFRFDGIDEPPPQRDAWDGDAEFTALVEAKLAEPHWQPDIAEIKRAYYNGATVQVRSRDGGPWDLGSTFNRRHGRSNVAFIDCCAYRIKPQENT